MGLGDVLGYIDGPDPPSPREAGAPLGTDWTGTRPRTSLHRRWIESVDVPHIGRSVRWLRGWIGPKGRLRETAPPRMWTRSRPPIVLRGTRSSSPRSTDPVDVLPGVVLPRPGTRAQTPQRKGSQGWARTVAPESYRPCSVSVRPSSAAPTVVRA
eukprot:scaffold172_cov341-Pavlova_lutheri.AAC.8